MPDVFELPFPQYRCNTCGTDLPLGEARLTVTCAEHRSTQPVDFGVRIATAADRRAIEQICDRALGETEVDVFGKTFDITSGLNLIAEADGELAGLLALTVDGGGLAILLLSVYPDYQGHGVGSSLLDAADEQASRRRLPYLTRGSKQRRHSAAVLLPATRVRDRRHRGRRCCRPARIRCQRVLRYPSTRRDPSSSRSVQV